jgi:asparagine synthase (glutamine-hydrolysing)
MRTYGRLPRVGIRTRARYWLGRRDSRPTPFPTWLSPELVSELRLRERLEEVKDRRHALVRHHRPEAYAMTAALDWGRRFESYDPGRTGVALDVRHPLFDVRLVEYALTIPSLPWCLDKALVRDTLKGRIPDRVRLRPKTALGDNPADTKMERGDVSWLTRMPVSPLLKRYVREPAALPPAESARMQDLRPLFLNVWLQSRHRDAVPDIDQEEDYLDALTARRS